MFPIPPPDGPTLLQIFGSQVQDDPAVAAANQQGFGGPRTPRTPRSPATAAAAYAANQSGGSFILLI